MERFQPLASRMHTAIVHYYIISAYSRSK
uniref:Uncharacterized protein n=1 Tax=Arundo donax TaxID=35708 RepID=A0A0A9GYM6_ARUDO